MKKFVLMVFVLLALATLLSACGPSPEQVYLEKALKPLENYSAKWTAFANSFAAIDFDKVETQQATEATMAELDAAAVALSGIPDAEVPESFKAYNANLKSISSETQVMNTALREAFKAYNDENYDEANTKIEAATASMDKINQLFEKLNSDPALQ